MSIVLAYAGLLRGLNNGRPDSDLLPSLVGPIGRVFRNVLPERDAQSVGVVVEDLPTDHRHHALKLLVSHNLPAAGAEIGELTFQDFEHGNIAGPNNPQPPPLPPPDTLSPT